MLAVFFSCQPEKMFRIFSKHHLINGEIVEMKKMPTHCKALFNTGEVAMSHEF